MDCSINYDKPQPNVFLNLDAFTFCTFLSVFMSYYFAFSAYSEESTRFIAINHVYRIGLYSYLLLDLLISYILLTHCTLSATSISRFMILIFYHFAQAFH